MKICLCLIFFALCCCTHVALCGLPKVKMGKISAIQLSRFDRQISQTLKDLDAMVANAENGGASSDCQWEDEACAISDARALRLLMRSKSEMAKFFDYTLTCSIQPTKKSCSAISYCFWDKDGDCGYSDWRLQHEDSLCVKAAPATFKLMAYQRICASKLSIKSCHAAKACEWGEDKACDTSFFETILGVPSDSFTSSLSQLMPEYFMSAMFGFMLRFHPKDPRFDWDRVLKWEIEKQRCPKTADSRMCDATYAFVKRFLPVTLYCSRRYQSGGDKQKCRKDSLCEYNKEEGRCSPAASVSKEAALDALLALVKSLKAPADREVWTKIFVCTDIKSEAACLKKGCNWNREDNDCELSDSMLFRILAKAGDGKKDGLCSILDILGDERCSRHEDKKSCLADKQCEYSDDECDLDDDVLASMILGDEPKLLKEYMKLSKKCKESTSEATCGKKTALNFPVA